MVCSLPAEIPRLTCAGSLFSIIWDQTGSHYKVSSSTNKTNGLSVYSNGTLIYNQPTLAPVNITLPFNGSQAATTLAGQPRYENIVANPNAPWGYPDVTASADFTSNGDVSSYDPFHLNDGLMWFDDVPTNRWTNNQSTTPFDTINVTFPRPRTFNSVSLGIWADNMRGGVISCPQAIRIGNFADNTVLAERNPWTGCVPNALNTISFDAPSANPQNSTTPATGANITTDFIQIQLMNQIYNAVAVSEIQIWAPENLGPRYEVEDGLAGTFLGGFTGTQSGLNNTVENQGVLLQQNGWVEVANVQAPSGQAGTFPLTVVGGNSGTLAVQMNYLPGSNQTVTFNGGLNQTGLSQTVDVQFLAGRNYVTLMQISGEPWIDAIVVG